MPANRSRTTEWRRCLSQIRDRCGAIEIAVSRGGEESGRDLVWRVRVLNLTESEIIVEQPMTLGQLIQLEQGIELVAILAVGQNRWTFTTSNLGPVMAELAPGRAVPAVRLLLPESVERCKRRNYYRLSTAALSLPAVEVWPLLDPRSVVLAERAIAMRIADLHSEAAPSVGSDMEQLMPDVGPRFTSTLLNIGGGGVGLLVEPSDAHVLAHHNVLWLRMTLPGQVVPICAMGKVVHTHIESTQQTYAGIAFDFSFNPHHQRTVVDQICRYIADQQRDQLRRSA